MLEEDGDSNAVVYTCPSKLCILTQRNHVSMKFKGLEIEKKCYQTPSTHDELFLVFGEEVEGIFEVVMLEVQWSMFSKNLSKVAGKIENRHSTKRNQYPFIYFNRARFSRTSIHTMQGRVS